VLGVAPYGYSNRNSAAFSMGQTFGRDASAHMVAKVVCRSLMTALPTLIFLFAEHCSVCVCLASPIDDELLVLELKACTRCWLECV